MRLVGVEPCAISPSPGSSRQLLNEFAVIVTAGAQ